MRNLNLYVYYDLKLPNDVYPELYREIRINEIMNAVKFLKRSKSCGKDTLLNEYFLESFDILSAHMCDMFNAILNSGAFPNAWTEEIIIPIHKKGSINDVNNYRGITLVSCLSKINTTILHKRIEKVCYDYTSISD